MPENVTTPVFPLEFRVSGDVRKYSNAATGVLADIAVPRKATVRSIWIAFDALNGASKSPWYMAGRIVFWLNGTKVTELPMSKGNIVVPNAYMNLFCPSTSAGQQPALRVTALDSYAAANKSADMPCFTFNVECDRITLEMDSMSVGATALSVSAINVLTGGGWTGSQLNYPSQIQAAADSRLYGTIAAFPGFNLMKAGLWKFTGAAGQTALYAVDKDAVEIMNNSALYMVAAPTLTIATYDPAQINWTVAPTFQFIMDGRCDLIAGFVVASQYPGGL